MRYRLAHSIRVANIGKQIAEEERLDVEMTTIACLLHDISYCGPFTNRDYRNHGRDSARMSRPFLNELGFEEAEVNEMCFGIAIHVDGRSDFDWDMTPLAKTVGDADGIDRYDVYRLSETLMASSFYDKSYQEQRTYVDDKMRNLDYLVECAGKIGTVEGVGTVTAQRMLLEKADYQRFFYESLKKQVENGYHVLR